MACAGDGALVGDLQPVAAPLYTTLCRGRCGLSAAGVVHARLGSDYSCRAEHAQDERGNLPAFRRGDRRDSHWIEGIDCAPTGNRLQRDQH